MRLCKLLGLLLGSGLALACSDAFETSDASDASDTERRSATLAIDAGNGENRGGTQVQTVCMDRVVRMAVASSLKDVATDLASQLGSQKPPVRVELMLGASSTHARQLALGAPIDLIVSADASLIDDLREKHLVDTDRVIEIARGRIVLLAHADSSFPDEPTDNRDSVREEATAILERTDRQRLAVPTAVVPLGRYARSWLASRGLLEKLEGRIVATEHARATLAAVEAGHVEFAIVYASDARLARRSRTVAEIDSAEHPPIRYVVARGRKAPACESIESAWAVWSSSTAQDALLRAGFLAPMQETAAR